MVAAGCSGPKTDNFGGAGGDGGAGDGGTEDGGTEDGGTESWIGGLNDPTPCTTVGWEQVEVEGEEAPQDACRCDVESTYADDVFVSGIHVTSSGEHAALPRWLVADMPWHATGTDQQEPSLVNSSDPADPTWEAWGDGVEDTFSTGDTEVEIAGTWSVWVSQINTGGVWIVCDDLVREGMTIEVQGAPLPLGAPPSMPVNPLGILEDDLVCVSGATGTTALALVDLPGWGRPEAIGVGGARQHMLSKLDSVTVTAWNGADRLVLEGAGGASVTLTPAAPSASLSGGDYWLGSARWTPARVDSAGTWTNPAVSVTHSCPATVGSTFREVDQAYALSLGVLDGAIDGATGGAGLGLVMTTATQPAWPVYVVRVFPLPGGPLATGETHQLTLEIQGSRAQTSLPITYTSPGHWSVDASGDDWSVQGSVTRRPNKLVLSLASGSVGALALSPWTVELPEYPDDGQ